MDKIKAKIDVKKILKEYLFTGKSGVYLDITLLPSDGDRFGNDYMIVQDIPKEKRELGEKGPILGNGKIWGKPQGGKASAAPAQAKEEAWPTDTATEDCPF